MPVCRCIDCGLLSMRNPDTRQLEEVDEDARAKGVMHFPGHSPNCDFVIGRIPLCAVMQADFCAESKKADDGRHHKSLLVVEAIAKSRECDRFFPWHRGFTPKEHREMIADQELRRMRDHADKMAIDRAVIQRGEDRWWTLVSSLVGALAGAAMTMIGVALLQR